MRSKQEALYVYVWRLPIPTYDPKTALHTRLAQLSEEAEALAAQAEIGHYGFQKSREVIWPEFRSW